MKDIFTFIWFVITGRFSKAFELLRAMNLASKAAFIAVGAASYVIHQYPTQILRLVERSYYVALLTTVDSEKYLPLSQSAQKNLAELIDTLERDQAVDLRRRDLGVDQGFNTWAVSQMIVALGDKSPVTSDAVRGFFERNMDASCGCWRETPQKQPHTAASGWTLFAMSKLGLPPPDTSIDFLLARQSPDGWWPLHPAKVEARNASTYATAWATLALCSLRPQLAADKVRSEKASLAVDGALNWLSRSKVTGKARWFDYPANDPHIKSISISGLAIHALHVCGAEGLLAATDSAWLDEIDYTIVDANDTDVSNTYIELMDGALDFDRTRHYKLQWQLVATVDAYPRGDKVQRAAAVQWIETILTPELAGPEVRSKNWVASELLYALKYLRQYVDTQSRSTEKS